ncbi:hypothetical protein, partial [Aquabacterium sp.]|uniref:hypothetical protein n=1 Tax=Aquabacterium sp. TaxID=1872578 RepID=UPI0025BCA551
LRSKRPPGMTPAQARASGLNAALEQAGLNQAEVALGHAEATPWLRGWVIGLRRLRCLRGHPPAVQQALGALLGQLRPAPGQLADTALALRLARAPATTALSLDLLAQLVSD